MLTKYDMADLYGRTKVTKALYVMNNSSKVVYNPLTDFCDLYVYQGEEEYALECKDIKQYSNYYNRVIIDTNKVDRLSVSNNKYYLAYSYTDDIVRFYDFEYLKEEGLVQYTTIPLRTSTVETNSDIAYKKECFFDAYLWCYEISIDNNNLYVHKQEENMF